MQMIVQPAVVNNQILGPHLWRLEDEWRRYQVEVQHREEESWNMALIGLNGDRRPD